MIRMWAHRNTWTNRFWVEALIGSKTPETRLLTGVHAAGDSLIP